MALPPFITATRPVRRKRTAIAPRRPVPVPPVLVAVAIDRGEDSIALTFDVAIDISAFDDSQISLNGSAISGPAYLTDPWTVEVRMWADPPAPPVLMSATATTGIAAMDGGAMWAGCADVPVPFP